MLSTGRKRSSTGAHCPNPQILLPSIPSKGSDPMTYVLESGANDFLSSMVPSARPAPSQSTLLTGHKELAVTPPVSQGRKRGTERLDGDISVLPKH